jgi:small GTP-binding protein
LLASVGSDPCTPIHERSSVIHLWELDFDFLLGQAATPAVAYKSAKIVLVGDSGVGKTELGWRLAHGEFKEHASTHGQQFWVLDQLGIHRADGAQCEAVLWDLAGQPDYRLIHALFLDDADLALVLFDPTDSRDPLHGVEFWLKQLKVDLSRSAPPTLLVAARSDRGTATLTREELDAFCQQRGIRAYLSTSARQGEGVSELIDQMKALIPWQDKPATVTTTTFKRIKDYVLELKESRQGKEIALSPPELRKRLQAQDTKWQFTDAEMLTAVGHLETHGYVKRLRTSRGEMRILLAPELLNNLAASFVLEARRNPKGLGSLEERRLLGGEYSFAELQGLSPAERAILLDSAALLFLEHNVCFRETSPLTSTSYLVFPDLINPKRPLIADEKPTEDGVSYTVSGAVENVHASLVVLLGYTQTFTRTDQWRNHARYEVGDGLVCGFRQDAERAGELDFVLYFCTNVGQPIRTLFQGLFESFLARRNLTVFRYEPVACANGHALNRNVVRERLSGGANFAFCPTCGERTSLPRADQPIQLTHEQQAEMETQRRIANLRSRFEQALFRVQTSVKQQGIKPPTCFISYAWGEPQHERWVERELATDLHKAGIDVVLDRWENARIGASIPRFVERVATSDRVVVVGTPSYRQKYDNKDPKLGFVVAAEGDLIGKRMLGTEAKKQSVLPVLLAGTEESSLPPLLQGRVCVPTSAISKPTSPSPST